MKGEATQDLFSAQSDGFKKSTIYMGVMIGSLIFIGVIYEIIRLCCKKRPKIVPGTYLSIYVSTFLA